MKLALSCTLALFMAWKGYGQTPAIEGYVVDEKGDPVPAVNVILKSDRTKGTISNAEGFFRLELNPGSYDLLFSHIQYGIHELANIPTGISDFRVTLKLRSRVLEDVQVEGVRERDAIDPGTRIDARAAQNLPSAVGDFNKVLLMLPGVAGNNELSSATMCGEGILMKTWYT